MDDYDCLEYRSAGTSKKAGATVYLMEELGDARMRCDQLVRQMGEVQRLIEKSGKKDELFEAAGHLIHAIPDTLLRLQKALQAVALAAGRIDYEELKQQLRPEKVHQLENVLQDVRIRHVQHRSQQPQTPQKVAERLRTVAATTRSSGALPKAELIDILLGLEAGQKAAGNVSTAGALEWLAEVLEGAEAPSKYVLAASLRRMLGDAQVETVKETMMGFEKGKLGGVARWKTAEATSSAQVWKVAASLSPKELAVMHHFLHYGGRSLKKALPKNNLGEYDANNPVIKKLLQKDFLREGRRPGTLMPESMKIKTELKKHEAPKGFPLEDSHRYFKKGPKVSPSEQGAAALTPDEVAVMDHLVALNPRGRKDAFEENNLGEYGPDNPIIKKLVQKGYVRSSAGRILPNKKEIREELSKRAMPKGYQDLSRTFYKTKTAADEVNVRRLERMVANTEKQLKEMQHSLGLYKKDPGKNAPQLENLAAAANGLMSAARMGLRAMGKKSASDDEKESRFEEGKPADPTKNMSPEDAAKWKAENAKNRDKFKAAASILAFKAN